MKLPAEIEYVEYQVDPETEYDALFRMPPLRLSWFFHRLNKKKTKTVVISINNQWVSYIKGANDPNIDRGSDPESGPEDNEDVRFHCSRNGANVQIEMENGVNEVENALCMFCLHEFVNEITNDYTKASQVTVYMDQDVRPFMYTVPRKDSIQFMPPLADHYHKKSERDAMKSLVFWEDDEDEAQDMHVNGDGHGDGNEDEIIPEAGAGHGDGNEDEIIPEAGDEAEVAAQKRKREQGNEEDEEPSLKI